MQGKVVKLKTTYVEFPQNYNGEIWMKRMPTGVYEIEIKLENGNVEKFIAFRNDAEDLAKTH